MPFGGLVTQQSLLGADYGPFARASGQQSESWKIDQAIRQAADKFKEAKSDEDKRTAEDEMSQALEAQYEYRLNQYEQHLDELEANLKKMREQLARKRSAKSDVVRLKLQMLKYEVDDLGWPSGSEQNFLGRTTGAYSVAPLPSVPAVAPQPAKLKTTSGAR